MGEKEKTKAVMLSIKERHLLRDLLEQDYDLTDVEQDMLKEITSKLC